MKKNLTMVLVLIFCLILTGCGNGNNETNRGERPEEGYSSPMDGLSGDAAGGENQPSGNGDSTGEEGQLFGNGAGPDDPAAIEALIQQGFTDVRERPFGQYRSEDELLAIINGTVTDPDYQMPDYRAPELSPEDEELLEYGMTENVVVFDDSKWEESGVIFVDLNSQVEIEGLDEVSLGGTDDNSKRWTESEYTKGLPLPAEGISQIDEEPGSFSATVTITDISTFTTFLDAAKAAGFTEEADEMDYTSMGYDMFSYEAKKEDGRKIILTRSGTMFVIELQK